MTLRNDIKMRKNEMNMIEEAIKRLDAHLTNYQNVDIKKLRVDDYLIHKRFVVNGEFFFIFKTVIVKQQLRLLCFYDGDSIVVIERYIKKNPRIKYYEEFKIIAYKYTLRVCHNNSRRKKK